MRVTNARDAALEALLAVERTPVGAQEALAAALGTVADTRDRALATMLVFGVLRARARLDYAIDAFASRGTAGLDPTTRAVLRIGAFQILHLDRIPARAAVSAAVDQARARGDQRRAGFVNAVLRNVARQPERATPPEGPSMEALAVRTSHPLWALDALQKVVGDALEAHATAYAQEAPVVVRCRMDASARDRAIQWAQTQTNGSAQPGTEPYALRLGGIDPMVSEPFADGLWVPQDEGSQLVARLLGATDGERVLDLCAGSGIKTTWLAEAVGPTGAVVAADVAPHKLDRLRSLVQRWGVSDRVTTAPLDATEPLPPELGAFDRVLVDAPCSGLGTMRRRPEIQWRRRPQDVKELAAMQRAMVLRAADALRPGGAMLYAVCTFTLDEGERVIESLLSARPEMALDAPPEADDDGFVRTSPLADDMDGFFIARLVRRPA